MSIERGRPGSPEQQANDVYDAIELVGNHPAKLITLLALSTFSDDEYIGFERLSGRLSELQGEEPGLVTRGATQHYCQRPLSVLGFVELGTAWGARGSSVQAARITSEGKSTGMAIAGALLSLEYVEPPTSLLQKLMGNSSHADPKKAGESTLRYPRASLYQHLLERPAGMKELKRLSGINSATLYQLGKLGVLQVVNLRSLSTRTYDISKPPGRFSHRLGAEVHATLLAAIALRDEGVHHATGTTIIERAAQLRPDLSFNTLWEAFSAWMRMSVRIGSGFIQETRPLKRGESSEVRITDEYRPHIKAFLRTRRLLAENSPEGDSFRATARQQARALITSPENLTIILKGREVTSFPETWTVDAKCRKNRVDPELFFPVGSKGPAVAQAEEAKRICGDCPVRMPCLKTALDNKDEFGIWGGVWLENREELTPALKARLRTIRIEYPEVGAL